ncbi:MAG: helix-turn-helix domain-containing protein [Patescibacteria group bacterium]|jgi:cytoskeletal protein RodZ
MSEFVKKPVSLDKDFIGSYVKKIREKKEITLEEISRQTKVNIKYLIAIENGNYKELPKGIYSKIFFKKYIDFLEIRHKNIVNDFIKEQNRGQSFDNNIFFNKIVDWKNLLSLPKVIRNLALFVLIAICFFYLLFYFKNIFSPPELDLSSPLENQITEEFYVEVIGKTDPESEVRINSQLILIDQKGNFKEDVSLKTGINVIVVSSKKKYSQENKIIRQILVE